jgi:hypothetical protein
MTNDERKPIVKQLLQEGRSLSEILDHLHREHNDHLTYMELRLLLSEMPDTQLPEKEAPKPPPAPAAAAAPAAATGKLSISVDQMPAPGAILSGYARFGSGAKAHWFLDELGRLGVEPELGSGKPTDADMKEFTSQLRTLLQHAGGPM